MTAARATATIRTQFAAAPNEPAWALRLTSTLFPQLPARDMDAFRVAVVSGIGLIVALGVAGLFTVGVAAAAVLVPLLVLLYLYDVDIYEDEPLRVVGLTMLWGALAGVGLGLVLRSMRTPVLPPGLGQLGDRDVLLRVVAFPLAHLPLALVGPALLLRYRRFNDVLDGAIFGAASGATLACTQLLVVAWPVLAQGLHPTQDTGSWTVRLVELAVLLPVIAAGSVGSVAAALWLRFRAPGVSRGSLGLLGRPEVALLVGAALMVTAALSQQVLSEALAAIGLLLLAGIAIVLLRRAIHLGLLQEADEVEPGPPIECASCHRATPYHTFCGHCGVALRALPKTKAPEQ